ncbi:MerR family transcriptional regulator [Rhizobacter sp. P5_C2]
MKSSSVKLTFTLHEVVVLTGFSKHMLDYLVRDGIFAPSAVTVSRRGIRRQYSYSDVVLLRALNVICAGKGRIRHLKTALANFRRDFGPIAPGQRIDKQLFVLGDELCLYSPSEGARQLRSGQLTFSFVVDLSVVSQEVADCIEIDQDRCGFRLAGDVAHEAEQERQRIWGTIQPRRAKVS